MTPVEHYTWKYPQLSLPIRKGMSGAPEYLSIVRKGILPSKSIFPLTETGFEEELIIETPAGEAEVLYLPDREIFEYFVRVLAYRCEPVVLPASMGAVTISGINNWRKIEEHKKEFFRNGGTDWMQEFRKFTSIPQNYKDIVILISCGNYSALSAKDADREETEWLAKSRTIRTYHELAHFVSRKMFLKNKETLRDEIVADSVGIMAAFGYYDVLLAEKVLGIEGDTYKTGGRLENYVEDEQLEEAAMKANKMIDELRSFYDGFDKREPLELLLEVERCGIGIKKKDED